VSLAPGRRLGPYEIVAPLGAGGMGEVFRARDTRLGREVAVKVLPEAFAHDPDRLARFQREARAVAALSHPNILALHDFGEEEGTAYAVTELLEGETLRAALRRGPLPVRKAVEHTVQIARGLAAAHEKGIVHRDLKPENVFVTADGQVKILDFGLARWEPIAASVETNAETLSRQTTPGTVLGTVGYMSPEQAQGLAGDHRSDVFSLGCVLYEMLTGRRAFERSTAAETLTAILREDPPAFSAAGRPLPAALERTVRRCLEKSPIERFQSARDVAFALEAVSGDSLQSAASPVVPGPRVWRRPVLVAVSVVTVAAALGLGWFAGRRTAGAGAGLSYQRLTFGNGPIITARFGPDGKTVFYGAAWEGAPFCIFQTRPEGGELALGLEGADLLSVSRDGQLAVLLPTRHGVNAWWKAGTLAVVPTLGAAARPVSEDVLDADWSPDGRSLAVLRQVGSLRRVEFPLGHTVYETESALFFLRVSPTGDRIAFYEGDIRGLSVCMLDLSGRHTVLSPGWADSWNLTWSPDGREIWFGASKPCSASGAAIYAVDLAGHLRLLLEGPGALDIKDVAADGSVLLAQNLWRFVTRAWGPEQGHDRNISWLELSYSSDLSGNGRVALLNTVSECSGGASTGLATFLRPTDGSPPIRVMDGWASSLSPDGRSVLVAEPRALRIVPTGSGTTRTLPLGFSVASSTPFAQWSPDGDHIVVAAVEGGGKLSLKEVAAADGRVLSASQPFAPDPLTWNWMSPVSPDGRLIAVRSMDGRVLIVPLDGGPLRALPASEVNDAPVQWAADSRSVYVFRPGEVPAQVFRLSLDAPSRTFWRDIRPPDTSATGIGTLFLSRDGRVGVYGYQAHATDLYLLRGLR
jgi:eukaryotic-like serine/threonine-protein kinase